MKFSSIALPTVCAIPPLPLTSHHYRVYPSISVSAYHNVSTEAVCLLAGIPKALEPHECGHTPFLIATGLNMVIIRIKLKY